MRKFSSILMAHLTSKHLQWSCNRTALMHSRTWVAAPTTSFPVRKKSSSTSGGNTLLNHLQTRIKAIGPLTVADYMKEVLTNSSSGYYMNKDVFGSEGDFITSPEISQMFGEMLGVWVVNEWMNTCQGRPLQLVELGPGRGTLADDMLRVFSQFPEIKDKISVHFVEVSPTLSAMQEAKLTGQTAGEVQEEAKMDSEETKGPYKKVQSKYGTNVSWYNSLTHVPNGLSCFIAHEFLDALPIHKFQKTEKGWREVLVDVNESSDSGLQFVLAPGQTPASVALLKKDAKDSRDHIEVCPGAGLIVQEICRRLRAQGGMALLADYGHTGDKEDTFRAFKQHKLHEPLEEPGTADLTADVDFAYLKAHAGKEVAVHGPVTQESFLVNMGIGVRLQALLQSAKQEHWSSLISGFKMLTSPEQMGERFKFMAILAGQLPQNYKPAGFVSLTDPNDNQSS